MAEPDRPAPGTPPTTPPATPHETEEPAVHPQQPTDEYATDPRDTAAHPDLGTDRRDTAVLPDGSSTWPQPPSAGGGAGAGAASWAAPAAAPTAGRRSPDLLALTAAAVFCLVAVLGLVGTSLPGWMFGGGFVAVVLVVAGAGLLVNELRRART